MSLSDCTEPPQIPGLAHLVILSNLLYDLTLYGGYLDMGDHPVEDLAKQPNTKLNIGLLEIRLDDIK